MRIPFALAALAATLALTGTVHATVITAYDTTGAAGNETSLAATAVAPGLTALDLARGSGISATSASNGFAASGWNDMSANDYFSFGFTLPAGSSVNLTDLIIGTRSSGTGPGSVGLFYSGDAFSTNLYTLTQSGTDYLDSDIDLSSLTGLTGTVEFRLYMLNTISAAGGTVGSTGTYRITDFYDAGTAAYTPVMINGTLAAVPEPASLSLLALSGLIALRRRR